MLQLSSQKQLSKIRRQAKKRGLRVVRDHCGNFTVIATQIEPPRPLLGLDHVPLWSVEQAIFTPLPEPPPRKKRVARLTEPSQKAVHHHHGDGEQAKAPAHSQAGHFLALVEALRTEGGAS
jgi:hypothetical protein